jgi:hypothetical protein
MQVEKNLTYPSVKMRLKKLRAKMWWEAYNRAPAWGWVNFDSKYLSLGALFH